LEKESFKKLLNSPYASKLRDYLDES
jgi:hypothetical protein